MATGYNLGMSESVAYLNGEWIPSAELSISIDDFGFLLGTTLTEKIRTFGGQAYRTAEHIARLRYSLELVGWDSKRIAEEASAAVDEFVTRNVHLIVEDDDWNISLFVTPGKTADARSPTVCVYGHPIPFHHWAHQYVQGVEAVIVDVRQVPANCWPAELKCRSRMHYYLADQRAWRFSPSARAILLDQEGYVGEGSTANVIAYYRDRGLVTPRIKKVLPGVSQQVVFDLAAAMGVRHEQQDMQPADLSQADEVFFSSTSMCLLPVITLDGLPIGEGRPGPVFQQLLAAWSQAVGIDIAAQAQKFSIR